ncbi:MAG: alpha-hydroxy-acid oxidizing protein [Caldilinea sp. CFX5]|nr:alpha-hydroxy-acid oxidizing protein [Caldilinea sp. CFX5]
MNPDKQYPCVADMEAAAQRRIPKFMREYLFGGLGGGVSVQKNRQALNKVEFMPRYLADGSKPEIHTQLFGRSYDAPFGVAPVGLSGLIWSNAEKILAAAAKKHNIPYTLSTVSTARLEDIREIAGENAWFQLYTPKEPDVLKDLLGRCITSGYDMLLLTVDVPYETRREHDIRNGVSVPPNFDLQTLSQMVTHPNWALRMLRSGVPEFVNLKPYFATGQGLAHVGKSITASTHFIRERMGGYISQQRFEQIRSLWPGKLLVKGVMEPNEAKAYMALGADGLVVSNHGGRQLDAAPATATVLPAIRAAVGPTVPLLVDSGVRTGLDIARMLALGADFVIMGRPFLYALAALDQQGGDHVMKILKAELRCAMGQIGCASLKDLPSFLACKGQK